MEVRPLLDTRTHSPQDPLRRPTARLTHQLSRLGPTHRSSDTLRGRPGRLLLAAERLQSDHDIECRSNAAYEHYRATARDRLGRRPGGRAEPYRPPELPAGKVNTTDPDSRPIPIGFGFVQGYNAQASVNEQQIVLAAETTKHLDRLLAA